ncbi:MAG: tRNA dihydrouridine synthase DusB [Xanthomonadales bacterium]|jgi:tRNA-dihydrouridine synthase B|nr:tRNA dihydrouridine synthase DusB [Xanthomonadales bacterium]
MSAALAIGPHTLPNPLALAPMAGVTDLPFRMLCRELGAGYVVGEMLSSDPRLRGTRKSELRRNHEGEAKPIAVQIAGSEPAWMADAARYNVRHGAEIIDINMGCPAKKVCNKAAGSALLEDESLVRAILEATVDAVDVPVTLKIRTGPDPDRRNGVAIARIAEAAGIQALAVHGRTRADRFKGQAEYDTIREIREAVRIPVFANGDIETPQQAKRVLARTGADGLMFGRSAQGNPWIFREVGHYLATGELMAAPGLEEVHDVMMRHVRGLHRFYGDVQGTRVARKHFGWYLQNRHGGQALRDKLVRVETAAEQLRLLDAWFSTRQAA